MRFCIFRNVAIEEMASKAPIETHTHTHTNTITYACENRSIEFPLSFAPLKLHTYFSILFFRFVRAIMESQQVTGIAQH